MRSIGKLVAIGVDPHPGSHTACALDGDGRELGQVTVANDAEGVAQLRGWARRFRRRRSGWT